MKTNIKSIVKPILILIFLICSKILGVTNYVWQGSPSPVSPYTNWSAAAHVIQDAIDAANDGDLVLVTNGNYTTGGGLTPGFSLSNRVVVTKSITLQSVNGPTNTIIVGQGPMGSNAVRCAYLTNSAEIIGFTLTNGHTHVIGDSNYEKGGGGGLLVSGSIISNCTIIKNSAIRGALCCLNSIINNCKVTQNNSGVFCNNGSLIEATIIINNEDSGVFCYYGGVVNNCSIISNNTDWGGGIFCYNGGNIYNSTISGNVASDFGGGINCNSGGFITNCITKNNKAKLGGGIYFYQNGEVNNSGINKNFATEYGGGVYLSGGGIVSNCTISGNTAGDASISAGRGGGVCFLNSGTVNNSIIKNNMVLSKGDLTEFGYGGGVFCWSGGILNNCLISGNNAGMLGCEGGGVFSYAGNSTMNNCTIVDNYARETAGGVYAGSIRNCIVENNYNHVEKDNYSGGTFVYSCSTPLPTGEGNISNNPMFEFASTGNYHLAFGSPCINAGTNAFAPMPWDLDGNPRIVGGRVDMGCYEAPIPEISICSLQFAVCSLIIFFNLICRKS